ncbi:MAG: hypothetical protein ACKVP2_12270 [Burkholderiales bacterium]
MSRRHSNALAAMLLCSTSLFAQTDTTAQVQSGLLVWRDPSCFFFVLKLEEKYSLFEFLGGPSPLVGHTFEGSLNAFGTRKIENKTEGKPTMVYSEIFELSKSQMEKKIPKFCKKRKEFEELSG